MKVHRYEERVNHPDRVLYPLRRTGPKRSRQFERITWDAALSEIAERFRQIVTEHGAEAIVRYSDIGTMGTINGLGVGDAFFHRLGASVSERTFCNSSASLAYTMTLGLTVGLDPESMAHSKLIILWGCNMLSTMSHGWRFVTKRGAMAPSWW